MADSLSNRLRSEISKALSEYVRLLSKKLREFLNFLRELFQTLRVFRCNSLSFDGIVLGDAEE
jgi:hypothetical protein